ncbi:MAG: thioredoxin domain-containing protein [Alphaproteobacteria bacterium]|nr:thioredoxin domain-containing protein [Alphaproteobacteria bacterium]
MTENLLAGETSPYLHQHRNNPVHWSPWGEAALARARAENKPILLSVGYAACHWCHVMAHESFENPEIAALMNKLFINIKVDREERPDLDAIYQASLAIMGEQGGWPLTMFLTPGCEPFWGGTYFPPEPRYGRPGFAQVLQSVASTWEKDHERVLHNVEALRGALEDAARPRSGGGIASGLLDQVAGRIVGEIDMKHGGMRGAPKFPQPSMLIQLWRAWGRLGEEKYRDAVTVTLNNVCQGGIYDHLGGGFSRYSVDERWLAPHFEKMLYDNAQLLELLSLVWLETREPLYARRIEETVGWILREMTEAGGGFASSLDADSEGVEGKFYVWSKAEVDTLLGGDSRVFSTHYGVTKAGNWEGANILNRLAAMEFGDDDDEATLTRCRATLLEAREPRIRPGKDDKVLADWNGLMIGALAMVGQALDRPDWVEAAAKAYRFVCDNMVVDGRLRHSWRAGRVDHPATLDDHANLARAALLLLEATGDEDYLAQAEGWITQINEHYQDDSAGGYFFAASDTPDLIVRNKSANDNPTPSGNGIATNVLARLWLLTGKDEYRTGAEAVLTAFSGEIARNFFPLSTLLNAADFLLDPLQIVIIADRDDKTAKTFTKLTLSTVSPNRVLQWFQPGTVLPEGHPARGKAQKDNQATVYVCRGQTCSLPITDPGELAKALGKE